MPRDCLEFPIMLKHYYRHLQNGTARHLQRMSASPASQSLLFILQLIFDGSPSPVMLALTMSASKIWPYDLMPPLAVGYSPIMRNVLEPLNCAVQPFVHTQCSLTTMLLSDIHFKCKSIKAWRTDGWSWSLLRSLLTKKWKHFRMPVSPSSCSSVVTRTRHQQIMTWRDNCVFVQCSDWILFCPLPRAVLGKICSCQHDIQGQIHQSILKLCILPLGSKVME